jgi:3-phenylpropionate/trans-cinnamate dioxygenase ferredoxin reductase component
MEQVVIIGAGHAGVQCAASLREGGFSGAITMVAEEEHLPYQRPPLSKDHLGEAPTPLPLRGETFYGDNAVELLSGLTATRIDRDRHEVLLSDGRALPYSALVLATGAQARWLPGVDENHPGVHQIRTLGDAEKLRAALAAAGRAVVVGAGFLGLEFAAVARKKGLDVTVLEGGPRVLGRSVSPEMSAHLATAHEATGIRLRLGEGLASIESRDHEVEAVVGASGAVYPADLVLLAVGANPRDDLAREAGLEVADGILVDAHLRTSDPAILAIGDCARLSSPAEGSPGRLESVQNATDQARHAAELILGGVEPFGAVPWFWSYQGALRLQIAGVRGPEDATVTIGDVDAGKFSVLSFREGRLTCVESLNRPADHLAARRLLAGDRLPTPGDVAAPDFQLKKFAAGLTPVSD